MSEATLNVLLPGDVVFIPDRQPHDEPADTGKRHAYFARASSLKLLRKI